MNYISFLRENARWLAAGLLLTFTSAYGQTYFISVFAGEIRGEFGLSHGAWGGIYTLGTTASALVMIWSGTLTDHFRVRHLGAAVFASLAAACLFMASVSAVWALPFAIFALRLTGQGMSSHLAIVAMARWFVATRGRALSIASMGFAIGQAVMPIVFVALLASYSWRMLWVVAAVLALAAIPVLVGLLKHERTPQSIAKETHAAGMNGVHWQRRDVLRHWLFWLLIPSFLGPAAWGTALMFQQVHLAQVSNWTHGEFVAMLPLLTVTAIASTFATGWAIDRFGTGRLMPFLMLPFGVAFWILWLADGVGMLALGIAVFGIANGASATLPGAFTAEFFGTRHIGAIKAMIAAIMVFGSAIGPGISGWLIDQGVDFSQQMGGIAIYFLATALLVTIAVGPARRLLPTSA